MGVGLGDVSCGRDGEKEPTQNDTQSRKHIMSYLWISIQVVNLDPFIFIALHELSKSITYIIYYK